MSVKLFWWCNICVQFYRCLIDTELLSIETFEIISLNAIEPANMKKFQCCECGHIYTEVTRPQDFVCKLEDCPGGGLTGLVIPVENDDIEVGGASGYQQGIDSAFREIGLCILLMDASGSMEEPAFKDYPFQSKYNAAKPLSKREVVTDNAAKAIFELFQMLKKEDAYICTIKFDHRQSELFTMSVQDLLSKYESTQMLAEYLYHELAQMNGGTDINSALKLAYDKTQAFLKGTLKLPSVSRYLPLTHTQFSPNLNMTIDVPNVRVLIYTDGEQMPEYGSIVNPFKNMQPDILMGAYIGTNGEKGCNDLKKVIGKCPIHNAEQFFVLDSPQKIATLRGLFRMASGTSGFCPTCLGNVTQR